MLKPLIDVLYFTISNHGDQTQKIDMKTQVFLNETKHETTTRQQPVAKIIPLGEKALQQMANDRVAGMWADNRGMIKQEKTAILGKLAIDNAAQIATTHAYRKTARIVTHRMKKKTPMVANSNTLPRRNTPVISITPDERANNVIHLLYNRPVLKQTI